MRKQLVVPSITVFNDTPDQSINPAATQDHIDWLIENGADMIVPGGSSGEFPALSLEESQWLFKLAVEVADDRVPVYAAACRYGTRDVIRLGRAAEKAGADGIMVIVPYYMKPDTDTIMEHFRAVRSRTDLPIILYNNPATVGTELSAKAILMLVDEGVVQGVKSSGTAVTGQPAPSVELALSRPSLQSYYGHDFSPVAPMKAGASGWFSLFPNVAPKLCAEIVHMLGDWEDERGALEVERRINPLIDFVWGGAGHPISIVKDALRMLGRNVGVPRLPLLPLADKHRPTLEALVQRLK